MDNLKKCAHILSEDIIKANRPKTKIELDIFPNSTPQTRTAPKLDAFDAAVNRSLTGEQIHEIKRTQHKPVAKKTLSFDEALKQRLG